MSEVKQTKKITPIGSGILVLVEQLTKHTKDSVERATKGGIYLSPDAEKEFRSKINKPFYVVAVGENIKTVKVGDYILRKDSGVVSFLDDFETGVDGMGYGMLELHSVAAIVTDFE